MKFSCEPNPTSMEQNEPVDTSIDEGKSRVDEEILDSVTTASFSDSVSSPSTPPIDPFHSSTARALHQSNFRSWINQ